MIKTNRELKNRNLKQKELLASEKSLPEKRTQSRVTGVVIDIGTDTSALFFTRACPAAVVAPFGPYLSALVSVAAVGAGGGGAEATSSAVPWVTSPCNFLSNGFGGQRRVNRGGAGCRGPAGSARITTHNKDRITTREEFRDGAKDK